MNVRIHDFISPVQFVHGFDRTLQLVTTRREDMDDMETDAERPVTYVVALISFSSAHERCLIDLPSIVRTRLHNDPHAWFISPASRLLQHTHPTTP